MNHAAHKDILTHLRKGLPATGAPLTAEATVVPLAPRRATPAAVQPSEAVLSRKWLELRRDIDCALARLDEGSYGYCQICGDRISDSHLNANPTTAFCASCAG
ncbi:TraR/DksA family transcriptional regulator [Phaeobacter gallaeciensis]|uniref:Transcriptional regulator, TraR/DksA family n=1 Tax=Phaeobacter gallaeciensis TaxID=60890 RepID=A0AAD0EC51_9RHOB|nr:TraR/DksA C4-type zinc finger protein [Phaeobacter gallaeciensis]AHD08760.1 transcriptional regulator, TraR/DksA family [Phaeobacter gallaeciensis DSM 26640]ATE92026.1 transcriptional regulator, TraR/DksA family [Phaeobacter gallaeciensis]ATE98150.1 transcriptional regulator, TraR/DksA family [Phaeobacter gallaeciensis]ATF00642.1 transcriptional regulator, TraR/DksA family [Phaeobacter gallaeciensis]ATF05073.1 transcriptional regulator, TraR/DksA family [Phaeobacter gallaeciensis]